ncbi:hypothetical protein CM1200mP19_0860 [bacterium]|nr:MAG: hypothetical protein CM1200mP19_0860 [bacterium]
MVNDDISAYSMETSNICPLPVRGARRGRASRARAPTIAPVKSAIGTPTRLGPRSDSPVTDITPTRLGQPDRYRGKELADRQARTQ